MSILKEEQLLKGAMKERTEEQIIAGNMGLDSGGEEVVLGGKAYLIRPKKGRFHSRQFRNKIGPIIEKLNDMGPLIEKFMSETQYELSDLSARDFEAMFLVVKEIVGPAFDELLDIVYDWSPEINADKEILEGNEENEGTAEDVEYISALVVIGKMVYGPLVYTLQMRGTTN